MGNTGTRILSAAMSVVLAVGLAPLPAFAAGGISSAEVSDTSPVGSVALQANDGPGEYASLTLGDDVLYDVTEGVDDSRYDKATNTLTLSNYSNGGGLYAEDLGSNFTIKLVGTNKLDNIYVNRVDGGQPVGLTISGNGSLTLNESQTSYYLPIEVYSGEKNVSAICLKVESSVNLTIYPTFIEDSGEYGYIRLYGTSISDANKAIMLEGDHGDLECFSDKNGGNLLSEERAYFLNEYELYTAADESPYIARLTLDENDEEMYVGLPLQLATSTGVEPVYRLVGGDESVDVSTLTNKQTTVKVAEDMAFVYPAAKENDDTEYFVGEGQDADENFIWLVYKKIGDVTYEEEKIETIEEEEIIKTVSVTSPLIEYVEDAVDKDDMPVVLESG